MKKLYFTISFSIIFSLSNFYKAQSELWGVNASGGDGFGVLYGMNTGNTSINSQYNFAGNPGFNPQFSKLLEGVNGKLYGMTNLGGGNNTGIIFEYDTTTSAYTRKIEFIGANGANPKGSLMKAANGKLYGMTQLGGTNNLGVIFEYNISTNAYNVLVNFTGTSGAFPGSQPVGTLLQPDPTNNKLYGVTKFGGVNDKGTLFEYDYGTNTYISKVDFDGNTGLALGANPVGQLVKAVSASSSTTTIYGMASIGGTNNLGTLYEYDYALNVFTKKVDFIVGTGSTPLGSLMLASNGRLYGTTSLGGASLAGVIFEYIISTNTYNKLYDFVNGIGNGGTTDCDLMQAANGKLYGVTRLGGATNAGVIFEFDVSIPATPVYAKKIDMTIANGSNPLGSLMQVSTGKLYGVTSVGGAVGGGVLFQYNIGTSAYSKKVDLNLSTGGSPNGGLVQSSVNGKLYGLAAVGGTVNNSIGVIYEYDKTTSTYAKKVDLTGTGGTNPGSTPLGSLIQATNLKLYGLTSLGGSSALGTLFSYDVASGAYTKLIDFSGTAGANPGGSPFGSLVQFSGNGKLYGMTKQGGTANQGVIFEFDPIGNTYTKKADLSLASANGYSAIGSMVESSNKLYGMTQLGGANNLGVIFEYDPTSGVYTKKIDFTGTSGIAMGSLPFGSMVQSPTVGILYGMTKTGGVNDLGVIFEYNVTSNTYTKKYDFAAANGSQPLGSLIKAANNKLYGVTNSGGSNSSGVLFEYDIATTTYTKKIDFTTATGNYPLYTQLLEICTKPLTPGSITSSTNSLCQFTTGTQNYGISAVSNATSYVWSLPAGSSITSSSIIANITADMSGVTIGTYSFGVAGVNICGTGALSTSNLTVNALPTVSVNSGVVCAGSPFTIIPTGASTYSVQGGSFVVSPSGSSTYTVTGTSTAGCLSSNTATSSVTVNALPTIGVNSGAICAGSPFTMIPTGVISSTVSGGSLVVSPGTSTSYTIVGTDGNNCVSANTATSNVTVNPLPVLSVNSPSICAGAIVNLSPTGAGVGGTYTTGAVNGAGPFPVSPASSQSYTFTGSTSFGCVSAITVTSNVTVNALPIINVNSPAICAGASANLIPTGAGVGGTYTMGVVNGAGPFIVSPASSQSYTFSGSTAFGCISASSATSNVTVNPLPSISVNSPTMCAGLSATLNPSGAGVGGTYTTGVLNGVGPFVVSPASSQSYSFAGTTALGCVSSNTPAAAVTVFTLPVMSVNNPTMCFGKNAVIIPSGAGTLGTYTVIGTTNGTGPFTVTPAASTIYSVTGTNSLGCISSNTVNSSVTVYTLPVISVNNSTMCVGKSATLTPSGAGTSGTYTMGALNGAGPFTVSPATSTNYTVAGASSLGCISSNTVTSSVTVFTLPIISVSNGTLCAGSTYSIIPSGAANYTMTGPVSGTVFPVSPPASISYTIAGASNAGCVSASPATANLTVYALPSLSVNTGTMCFGKSFTLNPSGAANYTIQPNNIFTSAPVIVSPTNTTVYTITGASSVGCLSAFPATSTVGVIALPVVSSTNGTICFGNIFTTTVTGASSYTYVGISSSITSIGSITLSPPATANYSVYGTSPVGCVSTLPSLMTLTVNPLPLVSIANVTFTNEICNGATATLNVTGANSYNWGTSTNSFIIVSPSVSTTYSVTGTDLNNCSQQDVFLLTVDPLPTVSVISGAICPGNCYTLTPGGASTYSYSSGFGVVCPTVTTTYSVVGSSTAGCVSLLPAVATVSVVNILTVTISGNTSICLGGTVNLTANGASTYNWSTGANTNTMSATPTSNITYTALGSSGSCSNVAIATITVNSLPNVTAVPSSTMICVNESAVIAAFGAVTYSWNTSSVNPTITVTPTATTIYVVTGIDANGCVNTGSTALLVDLCTGIHQYSGNIWQYAVYPNPNLGDFVIETSTDVMVTIINALGQTVLKQQLSEGKNSIDLGDQTKGVYFAQLKNGNTSKIIKIVKQ